MNDVKDLSFLENYFALYRRLLLETDIKSELPGML